MSKHPAIGAAGLAVLMLLGAGIVFVLSATQRIGVVDDAYISYRYVLNLVRDHQLVFNLGDRVEGATNLLWMLVLAAATRLSGSRPEVLAVALSLVLYGVAVARVADCGRRLSGRLSVGVMASAAVFLNADVFLSATNGLEGALFAALLAEAFAGFLEQRELRLGVVLGLLFATRPEAIAVGLVLVGAMGLLPTLRGAALRTAVPWLGIVAAVTQFRLAYFGSWIPNSVVAKSFPPGMLPSVLADQSWPYLRGFVSHNPVLALVGLGIVLAAIREGWRLRDRAALKSEVVQLALPCAAAVVLASILVAARNGGDWMEHWRLLTQYAPAYGIGLAALAVRLTPGPQLLRGLTVPALALAGSLAVLPLRDCCSFKADIVPPGEFFAEAARRLETVAEPADVVAAEAAGLLPYRMMRTRIHDPTGLLDPYIARHGRPAVPYGKTDIDYTFGTVRPEFMAWHWAGHVLGADAQLRSAYRGFCYRFCDEGERAMVVLVRTDRLDDAVLQAFADWAPWPAE